MAVCLSHKWARRVDEHGHIQYRCTECPARVDWTAARRAHEILQPYVKAAAALAIGR
jgi:hypothetical protein